MGLLDDAIREHLELKRRRGADPGEVAHQERAALEPVLPAERPPGTDPEQHLDDPELDPAMPAGSELDDHDLEPVRYEGEHFASDPQAFASDAQAFAAEPEAFEIEPEPFAHEAHLLPSEPDEAIAHAGQETAEFDMEAVLGGAVEADGHDATEPAAGSTRPVAARPSEGQALEEDALEWEPAEHAGDGPDAQIPGQERFSLE
ncbi:MAG TPA: hypothetical protein VKG82_01760 [Solirubrobacteraceae bacterium]|nr:hypothetical protein [Solirubrobacteraceae bacterium]